MKSKMLDYKPITFSVVLFQLFGCATKTADKLARINSKIISEKVKFDTDDPAI